MAPAGKYRDRIVLFHWLSSVLAPQVLLSN